MRQAYRNRPSRVFHLPRPPAVPPNLSFNRKSRQTEIDLQVTFQHPSSGNQKYYEIPAENPPEKPVLLSDILKDTPDVLKTIRDNKRVVFHVVGDTGGVKFPDPQQIVADKMEADFNRADGAQNPAFFYHLGDVVYYYGDSSEYFSQFYNPYTHYPAPIFAIPGNHDGDIDQSNPAPRSLDAFLRNFCAKLPDVTPDAGEAPRTAMTEPNPYWTLDAQLVTVLGLYTNVPEGGEVKQTQADWFVQQLKAAPKDKALIVALHHPPYSADAHHGGSQAMLDLLDGSFSKAKRMPDLVLTGHVHNYQRFTRTTGGREIPFIVAGAGGYWHLHNMAAALKGIQRPVKIRGTDLTLESYSADHHGFLRIECTADFIRGEYYTAPRPQDSWSGQALLWDDFTLDLKAHRIVKQG